MVSLTRSGAARALLDHPEGWLLFFLLSHVRDAHLWNGLLVRVQRSDFGILLRR